MPWAAVWLCNTSFKAKDAAIVGGLPACGLAPPSIAPVERPLWGGWPIKSGQRQNKHCLLLLTKMSLDVT